MKKVMIFDMLYFLGYHLAKRLLDEGVEVIGIDPINLNNSRKQEEMLMTIGRNAQLNFLNKHISKLNLEEVCIDVDTVFLFYPNKFDCLSSPSDELTNRKALLQTVIHMCRKKNIRVVYVSSQSVYGQQSGLITEESIVQPVEERGITIAEEENALIDAAHEEKFPLAILRLSSIYGMWQPRHTFISHLLRLKIKGKMLEEVEIYDHLETKYIFVDDMIESLLLIGESKFRFEIYNLSNEEEDQLTKIVNTLFNSDTCLERKNLLSQQQLKISNKKIKEQLNFKLRYPIEKGISELWNEMEKWIKHDRTLFL